MKQPDPDSFDTPEEFGEAMEKYWDWLDFKEDERRHEMVDENDVCLRNV